MPNDTYAYVSSIAARHALMVHAATRPQPSISCKEPSKKQCFHSHRETEMACSMAGKTTYMKQIGVLTVMAFSGCL